MKIVDNNALLLTLKNPSRVTAVIPRSKELPNNRVLVKWGLDEAQVLKNLNIKQVPSPILGHYKWSGLHKPFAHQRDTASFLTLHRRAFCFNEQGCVDADTEYLSPTGWVRIADYSGGDVAQWEDGKVTFVTPKEYVKLPCQDMIRIRTKYGLDQVLSPEHRVLLCDGKTGGAKLEVVSAEELLCRHDAHHAGFRKARGGTRKGTPNIAFAASAIPTTFNYVTTTRLDITDDALRVQVAAIADGYFGNNTNWCVIRLKKERKKIRIRNLLSAAGIEYVERDCLPEGFTKFAFYAPRRVKEFDDWFWGASSEQLAVIADECMHWDGSVTHGLRFSTNNKASADFIQFAFAATGRTARVGYLDRPERNREYIVQVRTAKHLHLCGPKPTMHPTKSSDGFKYCFMVPSTFLVFRRNGCVFVSGNTGKTGSAIWAADYLMSIGKIKRVLIICPLSIMDSAWRADLFKFAMHRSVDIAYGTAKKREAIIGGSAEFVIINYDGVEIVSKAVEKAGFDLIIIDEASAYKTVTTKRWKSLHSILKPQTWLWMMTGTPAAQSPVDAYGLAKLVNPDGVPRFFSAFRDMVMYKVTSFRYEPRPRAKDIVHSVLQPAIRYTKAECLDLPEMTYVQRQVELTPQQVKYYNLLATKMTMVASGEEITAVNKAVAMNKLLQLSCGAVYSDTGETLEFDISNRYRVLKEVIDESSQKVLVFVPFTHVIDLLVGKLEADNVSVGVIRGDVPVGKRTQLVTQFQTTDNPRVMIIQPQAAQHGLTLTAANTVVWWGPTPSLETYEQCNARVHRAGQRHPCTVFLLQGSKMERRVYQLLANKIDVYSDIMKLYDEPLV